MRKLFSIKIFFALFIMLTVLESYNLNGFFDTTLNDLNNKPYSFSQLKHNTATVIIFLLSDCPASQSYSLTLNKLAEKYAKDSVQLIGVFPGKYSNDTELKSFRDEYKISFTLLKDPEMKLVRLLKATTAPSCFVINTHSQVLYKGRIDDWLYAVGKKKPSITENNLDDAIYAVIKRLEIPDAETKPIGCILEYE